MIRDLLPVLLSAMLANPVAAQTETSEVPAPEVPPAEATDPPVDHAPDESLSRHRTVFEALTERAIGRASRPVRFDWRRGTMQVGATGGLPAELNNFESLRAGGFARFPTGGGLFELALSYVWVSGTESTRQLALTPYRQPGRPDRFELDFAFGYPLAEGVVTALPGFIPTTELVLNGIAQLRYLIYPGGYEGLGFLDTLGAIFSGSLSDTEVENIEDDRLAGMEIDRARYGMQLGLAADLYFQSGFFVSNKLLFTLPILQFLAESELDYGFEVDLSVGFAF